jgi:hypothetical protein
VVHVVKSDVVPLNLMVELGMKPLSMPAPTSHPPLVSEASMGMPFVMSFTVTCHAASRSRARPRTASCLLPNPNAWQAS